jgi:hypothetical protein
VDDERGGGEGLLRACASVGDDDGPRERRDERKLNASTKKDMVGQQKKRGHNALLVPSRDESSR